MRAVCMENSLDITILGSSVFNWSALERVYWLVHNILTLFKIDTLMETWGVASTELGS